MLWEHRVHITFLDSDVKNRATITARLYADLGDC
jgi:hypothetical protein